MRILIFISLILLGCNKPPTEQPHVKTYPSQPYLITMNVYNRKLNDSIRFVSTAGSGDSIVLKIYLSGKLIADTTGVNYAKINWIDYN